MSKSTQITTAETDTKAGEFTPRVYWFKSFDNANGKEGRLVTKSGRSSLRRMCKNVGSPLVHNNYSNVSKHGPQETSLAMRCHTEGGDQCSKDKGWAVIKHGRIRTVKKYPKSDLRTQVSNSSPETRWRAISTPKKIYSKTSKSLHPVNGKLEWDEKGRPHWRAESVEDNSK